MAENTNKPGSDGSHRTDRGTVLDRIPMPPMSGEEALRRFDEQRSSDQEYGTRVTPQSELSQLHPVMRLLALIGTLGLIVGVLIGVLYLIGR